MMRLRFDGFTIDSERYELRRGGEPLSLEPRVFDLLLLFARHPHRVFSREALVDAVWQGRLVSDATVSTCIKSARKALGDSGAEQRFIETVRGRGFRFRADVSDVAAQESTTPVATTPGRVAAPALLVLPFRPLSDDRGTAQLSAALSDELLAVLTRIPLLRISAEHRRFTTADVTPGLREMHEALAIDFVVEAGVQWIDDHYHINVALSDAASGFRLWSERIDVTGTVGTALRDGLRAVIGRLEPQLYRAIREWIGDADADRNGRLLFLQASAMLALQGWHHTSFATAADILRESSRHAPDFALAPAFLSLVLGFGDRIGLLADRQVSRREALDAAERSLELDGLDSTVLGYAGCALADIGYPGRALPMLRNAVEINPANAQAWAALGSVCLLGRRFDEGIAHLKHGIAISPLDSRLSIWGALLSTGLLQAGAVDEAVEQGRLACQRDDRNFMARVVLAGALLARDETAAARGMLDDAFRIKPDLSRFQVQSLLGRDRGRTLLRLRSEG